MGQLFLTILLLSEPATIREACLQQAIRGAEQGQTEVLLAYATCRAWRAVVARVVPEGAVESVSGRGISPTLSGTPHERARRLLARAWSVESGRPLVAEVRGAVVAWALPDSAGAAAGFETGDWIRSYGGVAVRDAEHFVELTSAGEASVPLTFVRHGYTDLMQVPPGRLGLVVQ